MLSGGDEGGFEGVAACRENSEGFQKYFASLKGCRCLLRYGYLKKFCCDGNLAMSMS